jgi:hypothetical protein
MSKKGTTKLSKKAAAGRGNGRRAGRLPHTTPAANPTPLQRLAGETEEEREKRLAARRSLTLRAFRMTYENRHRRKTS